MEKLTDTPPSPEALPLLTAVQQEAQQQTELLQTRLMEKTKEMLSAAEPDIPRITREMQRLRVGLLTYAEVLQNLPDPTLKQEIALLNKMTGGGFEDDPENDKAKAMDAAASRVRSAGLDPDSAADLVRGLRALQAIAAQQSRDDQRRTSTTS